MSIYECELQGSDIYRAVLIIEKFEDDPNDMGPGERLELAYFCKSCDHCLSKVERAGGVVSEQKI